MKKIIPTAVFALSLAARSLFGNPLESTILKEEPKKEFNIAGNVDSRSFSVDFSAGKDWKFNFASDAEFIDAPRIKNIDAVVGNDKIYLGASYENLSTETILEDSYLLKLQTGIKPFDWLDFCITGALVDLPNMQSWISYKIPMTLSAFALNANVGKEFELDSVSLFPWLSVAGSVYLATPGDTDSLHTLEEIFPDYGAELMALPFNHLNVKGGLDVKTRLIDVSYQGEYQGNFSFPPIFNIANKIGINAHDEDRKNNLEYAVSLITKPVYFGDKLIAPVRNELQFDVGGFVLFDNGLFLKGKFSSLVDFLTENQYNITASVGKKFDFGNIEAYYNSKNNVFGLQFSTQLDKTVERESKTRKQFDKFPGRSIPENNILSSPYNSTLHSEFGNTLEEAKAKIKAGGEQELSRLLSFIQYKEHNEGTFTAREEYEIYGWGDCEDTNGNLGVELERMLDHKEVYAVGIRGPFISHATIIIKDKNGKFDLRDFQDYYNLNADTPQQAVEMVFPGANIYDDGTVSSSVSAVRNAVERRLYDWNK